MFWKRFNKKKPTKDGWYQCTVEVPGQQRYVMDLYWCCKNQEFYDNRVRNVFHTYNVLNYKGERIYTNNLCNRTDGVIAWRKMPRTYMRGFVKEV